MPDFERSRDGAACAAPGVPSTLPWLHEAWAVMHGGGTPRAGRARMQLAGAIDRATAMLSLPWCGAFVGHCVKAALPEQVLPPWHYRARPWLRWGRAERPQLGAVLVFWHYRRAGILGHVGFYWAEDADGYHVLSGNQRDRILIQRYPKHRLLSCRWPAGRAAPGLRRRAAREAAIPFDGDWNDPG
jgi:uncharacterized protein (TIGR02594 family)